MTLIFGKLTATFVQFGAVGIALASNPNDPAALAQLVVAQSNLKSQAASNALWLTLIGIGMLVTTCELRGRQPPTHTD